MGKTHGKRSASDHISDLQNLILTDWRIRICILVLDFINVHRPPYTSSSAKIAVLMKIVLINEDCWINSWLAAHYSVLCSYAKAKEIPNFPSFFPSTAVLSIEKWWPTCSLHMLWPAMLVEGKSRIWSLGRGNNLFCDMANIVTVFALGTRLWISGYSCLLGGN